MAKMEMMNLSCHLMFLTVVVNVVLVQARQLRSSSSTIITGDTHHAVGRNLQTVTTTACSEIHDAPYKGKLTLNYEYRVDTYQGVLLDVPAVADALVQAVVAYLSTCDNLDRPLYAVEQATSHTVSTQETCLPLHEDHSCHVIIGSTSILLDTGVTEAKQLAYDAIKAALADEEFISDFAPAVASASFLEGSKRDTFVVSPPPAADTIQGSSTTTTIAVAASSVAAVVISLFAFGMYRRRHPQIKGFISPRGKGSPGHIGIKPGNYYEDLDDDQPSLFHLDINSESPSNTWSVSDITSEGSIRSGSMSRATSTLEKIDEETLDEIEMYEDDEETDEDTEGPVLKRSPEGTSHFIATFDAVDRRNTSQDNGPHNVMESMDLSQEDDDIDVDDEDAECTMLPANMTAEEAKQMLEGFLLPFSQNQHDVESPTADAEEQSNDTPAVTQDASDAEEQTEMDLVSEEVVNEGPLAVQNASGVEEHTAASLNAAEGSKDTPDADTEEPTKSNVATEEVNKDSPPATRDIVGTEQPTEVPEAEETRDETPLAAQDRSEGEEPIETSLRIEEDAASEKNESDDTPISDDTADTEGDDGDGEQNDVAIVGDDNEAAAPEAPVIIETENETTTKADDVSSTGDHDSLVVDGSFEGGEEEADEGPDCSPVSSNSETEEAASAVDAKLESKVEETSAEQDTGVRCDDTESTKQDAKTEAETTANDSEPPEKESDDETASDTDDTANEEAQVVSPDNSVHRPKDSTAPETDHSASPSETNNSNQGDVERSTEDEPKEKRDEAQSEIERVVSVEEPIGLSVRDASYDDSLALSTYTAESDEEVNLQGWLARFLSQMHTGENMCVPECQTPCESKHQSKGK